MAEFNRLWTAVRTADYEGVSRVLNDFPLNIFTWQVYFDAEQRRPVVVIEHSDEPKKGPADDSSAD